MVMVLVGVRPWLTGTRAEQQSHGGRDVKTPRPSKRGGDHVDGSDKSSRVSSGSTLKTATQRGHKQAKLTRQLTRTSTSFSKFVVQLVVYLYSPSFSTKA